jgi:hypothetical protein
MEEKIEKIIVKTGDELIDIVREISNSNSKKILVSFVEESDILISSINLKVLLDSADEKESLLVLQIPNSPTGIRNAKLAGIPVIETPGLPSEEVWDETKLLYKERSEKNISMKEKLPQDYKSENITSFEQRINSVLNKSQEERTKSPTDKEEKNNDFVVDQDINFDKDTTKINGQEDLRKMDFKNVSNPVNTQKVSSQKTPKLISNLSRIFKNIFKKDKITRQNRAAKKDISGLDKKQKFLKLLPKLIIPLVLVSFLAGFIYYRFAPYVKATIFIESKPVEVEKTFIGSENINEIDFENGEIPTKTESVTKSVSDVVDATGTAYRGDKSTGSVTISYINPGGCTDADEPITLNEGQQISTDGKNFILTGSANLTCNGSYGVVGVEAVEVGEEYNLPAHKYFNVNGYDVTKVFGTNSDPFTGGSKEQYTVLSKQDVDNKVKELTDIAFEEAENSLQDIGMGWELIDSTVKTKVKDGSVKTAVAIGTEANSSDVSLEVESFATYYYTEGVDAGLNSLLTEAAVNQNLFQNSEGLSLALTGDIEKELKVKEDEGKIEITLTASSSVEPSVERESLINELRGMKWEEGVNYLNDLTFTADRTPVVQFNPESFPQKLRHFPSRQGRIDLIIEKVVEENS